MALLPHQARDRFNQPVRQITSMLSVLGFTAVGSYIAYGYLKPVFLANPYLNGVILGVFLIGLLACFWQVSQIITSVIWIEGYIEGQPDFDPSKAPRLLAPLAGMLGARGARLMISATSARSMLESVASRMDESRDITRYISNLLIFLGLLGTFFGLAITVPAVVETIRSLAPTEGEGGIEVFSRLMAGLEEQLGGMGTAFSSSLLGLAGSLVVGLLDLFAGHGQNGFYRELEEWLSRNTSVGLVQGEADPDAELAGGGGASQEAGLAAVVAALQDQFESTATEYARVMEGVRSLTESVGALSQQIENAEERNRSRDESAAALEANVARLAEAQSQIAELLVKATADFTDAESRLLLRQMDVQLLRIYEDNLAGRNELLQQLSAELGKVTDAIREQSAFRASRAAKESDV